MANDHGRGRDSANRCAQESKKIIFNNAAQTVTVNLKFTFVTLSRGRRVWLTFFPQELLRLLQDRAHGGRRTAHGRYRALSYDPWSADRNSG